MDNGPQFVSTEFEIPEELGTTPQLHTIHIPMGKWRD